METLRYRIGIDVGERSVGLAAIEFDDDFSPMRILSCVTHIHDGGQLPGTAKSPQSRLAVAGVARRTRRLVRNRNRRIKKLDLLLKEKGYPIPVNKPQTYEAWKARARLYREYVEIDVERASLLSLAIRHMARHRGWKNPWWSHSQLLTASVPSENFQALQISAMERFKVGDTLTETVGQLGALSARPDIPLRDRAASKRAGILSAGDQAVLFNRVRQEDQLFELQSILKKQKINPDFAAQICETVFVQERPHVPRERIGRDVLPGMENELRAPISSLEFQEHRIRSAVANLRIGSRNTSRLLTEIEHDRLIDYLLNWRDASKPTWREVAEFLDIPIRDLRYPSFEEGGSGKAPIDETSTRIESKFKKKSRLRNWWDAADLNTRADLITHITEGADEEIGNSDAIIRLLSENDELIEDLETLGLPAGRAAYSRASYRLLLEEMRTNRVGEFEALRTIFNLPQDWKPPRPSLEDKMNHPTVDRVLTIVRRFLVSAVDQWGLPEAVVIEHVRGAFMGPAALNELRYEVTKNTRANDQARQSLTAQGMQKVNSSDLRRLKTLERQQSMCLYCGTAIGLQSCELDHIVPRSDGGSNRSENLVAVCKECNHEKGARPFVVFAESSAKLGVSVDEAILRVKAWVDKEMSSKELARLKKAVAFRLKLSEDDEPLDERALASTAYAAREVRFRVEHFLEKEALRRGALVPSCEVYKGQINSLARSAGGVDSLLRLRGHEVKNRIDRRHHAIDAAVLTVLNPSVATTLGFWSRLRDANRYTNDHPGWKDFTGTTPGARESFGKWKTKMLLLSELLKESIEEDRIPVVRPLRLRATPNVGSAHKDTIEPLVFKDVRVGLTDEEVRRIADPKEYNSLLDLLDAEGSLSAEAARNRLGESVALFPSNAAYIRVRGGACAIGDTVHHGRIYAWKTKQGFSYGIIRVFAGEFPLIGFSQEGINILTHPIPMTSQAMRTADPTLLKRIAKGEAKEIGWIALDDEIEFDPYGVEKSEDKFSEFLKEMPERHWNLVGLAEPTRISILPRLLAREGIDDRTPQAVKKVLEDNRITLAVNKVLSLPQCVILRRSIMGKPRWRDDGLPISWKPSEAALRAFEG